MTRQNGQNVPKVLIIANEWSRAGGLEIVTQDIARAFAELGWQVTVLPAGGEGRSETLANGIQVKWLPPRGRIAQSIWGRFLRWPILAMVIKSHLKDGGLLILGHVHLLPLLDRLPESPGVSRWVWTHGIDAWGRTAQKWMQWLNQVDNIVAVSAYTAWHEKEEGAVTRVSVVLNSVDIERFTPTKTLEKIRRDEILICGRMMISERYKGHEELFEALPIAEKILGRPLRIRVVGTGNDMPRLKEKVRQMGLANKVLFAGRVTDDELLEAYRHCGVFAMPSRAEYRPETDDWAGEGFGLVYVEAQACGRPVVVSTDGGAPETVRPGVTGLLAEPRSPQANAEAIAAILADPIKADQMGAEGRKWAEEAFSFACFKKRIAEVARADKKLF